MTIPAPSSLLSLSWRGRTVRRTVEGWPWSADYPDVCPVHESVRPHVLGLLPALEHESSRVVPWARVAFGPCWHVRGETVGGTAAARHRPPLVVVSLSAVDPAAVLYHEVWHMHEPWLSPVVLAAIDNDGFGDLGVRAGCPYWDSAVERRARAFERFAAARFDGWWTVPSPSERAFDAVLRGDLAPQISAALYSPPTPRVTPGRAWRRLLPWGRS